MSIGLFSYDVFHGEFLREDTLNKLKSLHMVRVSIVHLSVTFEDAHGNASQSNDQLSFTSLKFVMKFKKIITSSLRNTIIKMNHVR